ncbi:Purine nucleoside phosphorylase DeoD-type [Chryseobacterium aquaeductus]|uniref:Uridine phosphorylase n=1 Tax=Chryseobacterium aquaeductus TaxID=2675056 RepID=A0A9N8QR84_9FLAO|nr:purine-nucleoside phosphorylase [Chryseobacterium aquaeductus]CAA7330100.1 Purine nucleoside phosphorylase DeoD-type [Chryseobacterium potabilaquae]CAD7801275.1 Purine nucleoside phosphorylase DeoD-type [Chryseobacterium aquaeductus]
MSVHISAQKGDIAKVVLQPGDPLRAKYIAENFIENAKLVSQTRGIFYYTGTYKGKEITVGASGMGFPSIGIYSFELYTEYEVETIIRIGTCGAYTTDLKVFDLLNVENAASESTYAKFAWEIDEDIISHQGNTFEIINQTAEELSLKAKSTNIHSSDIFYRKDPSVPAIATKYSCPAVEMEAFGLFANAKHLGKNAATILTVSDIIPTHENISADQREKALRPMIELALEAAWKIA